MVTGIRTKAGGGDFPVNGIFISKRLMTGGWEMSTGQRYPWSPVARPSTSSSSCQN
ncbi:hypothetical protein HMPREF9141_1643 [Prevotella multiformis DSM 16608]|uniref:Uncharacterized protein n=1 Tax=Prevotella multiformis DSM 16608 TaxID=888743 RepID=F0F7S6_9BACT|nr:hypothetical protein HMPREF9141_1643 [Prevotella multiformis DSM 16608]